MKQGKILNVTVAMLLASPWCRADEKSDKVESIQQLRQLSKYAYEYLRSHEGRLPKTFEEMLGEKKNDKKLLVSPLAADQSKPSYELLTPADKVSQIPNATRTVLIRSMFTTKDGEKMAAFVDGHVELISE